MEDVPLEKNRRDEYVIWTQHIVVDFSQALRKAHWSYGCLAVCCGCCCSHEQARRQILPQ